MFSKTKCIYMSDGLVQQILKWLQPITPLPLLRTQLYYLVCIVFRLALYNLVWVLRKEWYTPIIVGVFAFMAIIHLSRTAFQPNQYQWWSKKFQFVMSIFVFFCCIATYLKKVPTILLPLLLYSSLLGGLLQRWTCCCRH